MGNHTIMISFVQAIIFLKGRKVIFIPDKAQTQQGSGIFCLRNSKSEFIAHPFAVMERTSDRYMREI